MADPATLDREQLLDVVRKARNTNTGLREIIQDRQHDFAELRRLYEAALAENDVLRRQVQVLQRELAEERSRPQAAPPLVQYSSSSLPIAPVQYSSSSFLVSATPAEGITFVTYSEADKNTSIKGLYVMADAYAPGMFDRIPKQNYVSIPHLKQGASLLTRDVIYVGFWTTLRSTTFQEINDYFDLIFSLGARSILLCYIGTLLFISGDEKAGDNLLSQTRYRSDPRVSVVTLTTARESSWERILIAGEAAGINRRGAAQIRQWVQEHQK